MSGLGPVAFAAFREMLEALAEWRKRKKEARAKRKREKLMARMRKQLARRDALELELRAADNELRRRAGCERLADRVGPAKPLDDNPYGED